MSRATVNLVKTKQNMVIQDTSFLKNLYLPPIVQESLVSQKEARYVLSFKSMHIFVSYNPAEIVELLYKAFSNRNISWQDIDVYIANDKRDIMSEVLTSYKPYSWRKISMSDIGKYNKFIKSAYGERFLIRHKLFSDYIDSL